jgi:hypothetical protein
MLTQFALGLMNKIFRNDGRYGDLQALTQCCDQDAPEWLPGNDCQTIKFPLAQASIEVLRNHPCKSLRGDSARAAFAAGCMMGDRAATPSYGRCAIKDATWPIGLEIPVMQAASRVVQLSDKRHGRSGPLEIIDSCFGLVRDYNSGPHWHSPRDERKQGRRQFKNCELIASQSRFRYVDR